jgi:hypothetical protein
MKKSRAVAVMLAAPLALSGCLAEVPEPTAQAWSAHWKDVHRTGENSYKLRWKGFGDRGSDIAQSYCNARGFDYAEVFLDDDLTGDTSFDCVIKRDYTSLPQAEVPIVNGWQPHHSTICYGGGYAEAPVFMCD